MCGGGVEVVALAGNHALVGSRTDVTFFFLLKQILLVEVIKWQKVKKKSTIASIIPTLWGILCMSSSVRAISTSYF